MNAPEAPRDEAWLERSLAAGEPLRSSAREFLGVARAALDTRFRAGEDVRELVRERARRVDALLRCLWVHHELPAAGAVALVAVGGYGRGELHPHSDVDLLVLLDGEDAHQHFADAIERFVTSLWDTGLAIGHAVRTLEQCRDAAAADVTIATSLLEARTLCGEPTLLARLGEITGPAHIWPSAAFFRAKWDEQIARHRKFDNTEYNLEPNIKGCPGGLRDVQTVGWVAKWHFRASSTQELVARGFLTEEEYRTLTSGQDFLWRVRYALHMLADRPEDRLLFDYQLSLAKLFGYQDDARGLAVEHFMKDYFRWVLKLGVLNEMLIQLFDEAILRACEPVRLLELNQRFRVRNGYIEAVHDRVFRDAPWALLEIFTLMAQHEYIQGARAATIRLIHESRRLVDASCRKDPRANRLFLQLLASPYRVVTQLDRMKRYGVLGRFIPEFGRIIGQTQHDLFHVYSVDSHTLRVVRNMRRLLLPEANERFPSAAFAARRLPRPELLYLAGLYHDIAKGRGGDHSELGAAEAQAFCLRLGLSAREANLVSWLVRHHLVMSTTAQRRDIGDPQVIHEFARLVSDQPHLDHLYALTVADINATNPTLWNSWRASLLHTLYVETKRALRRGLENPVDAGERIADTRTAALTLLAERGVDAGRALELWQHMGADYLLRESATDIAWHTEAILASCADEPLVLLQEAGSRFDPVTQIFIYTRDRDNLFAVITATMAQLGLDVHGARVYSSADGHALDTFFVLEQDGRPVHRSPARAAEVRRVLHDNLQREEHFVEVVRRHTPRALKHFSSPTRTRLVDDAAHDRSILEVMTPDRAGLLARIGRVFLAFGIRVQNARITTLGERVEDVFFITDAAGRPIATGSAAEDLQQAICDALDRDNALADGTRSAATV
jgi:[protein-PII] uridylyltransferase